MAGASLRARDLIERSAEPRERPWANTRHPIVPVMIGDAAEAARFSTPRDETGK